MATESVPQAYFEELYRRAADPWNFRGSDYEREKYAATLQALPKNRYGNALEIACSIGVFTRMLAERCERLLAIDVSRDALTRAREWCADVENVRFDRCAVPKDYPGDVFDLTTVCEVGYYLGADDLQALVRNVATHSVIGASVVLVHWTPPVEGHASIAVEVHAAFRGAAELHHVKGFDAKTYRLDVFERI